MFMEMIQRIKDDTLKKLCIVQIRTQSEIEEMEARAAREQEMIMSRGGDGTLSKTIKRDEKKVGRNDPCPCGSGKKYKKCCGEAD
jgi:preprotein translocase subunit SecA